jgi:hypothetical protein
VAEAKGRAIQSERDQVGERMEVNGGLRNAPLFIFFSFFSFSFGTNGTKIFLIFLVTFNYFI